MWPRGKYRAGMASILVVEDDEAIRSAVRRGLTERGHAVATAGTGLAGLEQVLADHPQVVLLDLGLPDVNGLALISMIRAASQVPIIVITARDDDPTMVKALDGGADDYVVKPFGTDQVAARIRAVLRRSGGDRDGARAGPRRRPGHRRALSHRQPRRRTARAGPQGVRPAAGARVAARRGGDEARAAGRRLAAGVRRLRALGRRPPVVAAPQARRVRGRAAVPPQSYAGSVSAWSTRTQD